MAVAVGFEKAVPLIEYAKGDEGSLERAFIETFTATSDVMAVLPMKRADRGRYKFRRTAQLPTVAFRGWNEDGGKETGKSTIVEEGVFLIDEYIHVDRAEVDHLGPSERIKQERMKIIALSRNFTDALFTGDTTSDPREPDGLARRFNVLNTTMFHNSVASGGAALSLLNLDIAIAAVNGATHIIMSRELLPYVLAAARSPTLTNSTIIIKENDALGRMNMNGQPMPTYFYNGLRILWGYEPDDGAGILPFTEVGAGGGSAVTSSIYVVAMGDERLFAIEGTALNVDDEGMIPGRPFFSTHIKWDWGFVTEHPRSGARLTSITKAAIVA